MSDFMGFVFTYLERALILTICCLPLAGGAILVASKIHQKRYGGTRKFPWGKAILLLALAAYLMVLCYITIIRGSISGWRNINLHLFRAWREAWNTFSEKHWLNVLLNIGMFVPLGILLPLLNKRLQKWYLMLPAGFLTTLAIETIQYFACKGLCDVDDLFANSLGAMIGYWLVMAALNAWGRNWKRLACHGAALILAAASVGSIFVAYELQEYGNLSTAPAFRVDTSGVQWSIDCELSDAESTVSIYRTQPRSKEECEAIGRAFFAALGISNVDVTVYNEEVYLREYHGNRIAEVFFKDGHLEYWNLDSIDYESVQYEEVEEAELRTMLSEYGIDIPEEAEFACDGQGLHYFRLNRYIEGNTMTDGYLACVVEKDFGIREFQNRLVSFEYHGDAAIISAEIAIEQVKSGWISGGDWFERVDPAGVHIRSCDLVYQVDTKGFYQPVYEIGLASSGGGYESTVWIPALQ